MMALESRLGRSDVNTSTSARRWHEWLPILCSIVESLERWIFGSLDYWIVESLDRHTCALSPMRQAASNISRVLVQLRSALQISEAGRVRSGCRVRDNIPLCLVIPWWGGGAGLTCSWGDGAAMLSAGVSFAHVMSGVSPVACYRRPFRFVERGQGVDELLVREVLVEHLRGVGQEFFLPVRVMMGHANGLSCASRGSAEAEAKMLRLGQ